MTTAEFWARVDKCSGPVVNKKLGRCWLWKTVRAWPPGKNFRGPAKRAFGSQNGNLPRGKLVLHRCDVARCVRGSHLYAGTQRDNVLDRRSAPSMRRAARLPVPPRKPGKPRKKLVGPLVPLHLHTLDFKHNSVKVLILK